MSKTIFEELYEVLVVKHQSLCTKAEVAWAINRERAEHGYQHQSNNLIPEITRAFNRIRKTPQEYGFALFYKSTSRYEPYVAIPLNGDLSFSLTIAQRRSFRKGIIRTLRTILQVEVNSLRQMEAYQSTAQDPELQELLEDLIIFQRSHVLSLNFLLGKLAAEK